MRALVGRSVVSGLGDFLLTWLAIFFVATLTLCLAQPANADIWGFGDSLTDTGSFYAATGGTIPPSPPYYQGRFSNGPVWIEALSNALGQPIAGNLAWNGARVLDYPAMNGIPGGSPYGVPDIQTQALLFAQSLGGGSAAPGDVFAVWGGANDLFFTLTGQVPPVSPQEIAANVASVIATLAGVGADTFIVPNVPALGRTPFFNQTPFADALNGATQLFNAALAQELTQLESNLGIQIHQIDVYSLVESAIANPAAYGLTNVTDAAASFDPLTGLAAHLTPEDVNMWLWFDGVHPTARGHEIVGNFAAAQVVPEPASIAIWLMLGATGCGIVRRHRQTKREPTATI